MSECYAISRIASYKYSDCGGVMKEALRTLPNYSNPDCDASKSYLNVELVQSVLQGMTIEKYILKYREENNIKGRFNTNAANAKNLTNCMCQALFTASKEYLSNMSREEQIEYFKVCLEFFKKEFPSVHIVSAIIHFDETTPHMHLTFIPTVNRVKKKTGEEETIFSTTHLMPGKDFFRQYQDRFFDFISSRYDGFSRGSSDRRNLTVEEFKELSHFFNGAMEEKFVNAVQQIDYYKKLLDQRNKQIDVLNAELLKVQNDKKWFESLPLIGEFFRIIRNMKVDSIEHVLNECISVAHEEEEYIAQHEKTVDDILASATKRSDVAADSLSDRKKSLVQALFGKKDVDYEK